MVVRFITRRFIGEYDPNLEKVYTHTTAIDGEAVLFEILDAAGPLNVNILPYPPHPQSYSSTLMLLFTLILFAHEKDTLFVFCFMCAFL